MAIADVHPQTVLPADTDHGLLFDEARQSGSLDVLRFFLAGAVVYFHAGLHGASYAVSALYAFTVLSIYFGYGRPLADRFRRLIIPWVFWCFVFGALKLCEVAVTGGPLSDEFNMRMLLAGPAIHLWYLPFIFLASIAVSSLPERAILPVAIGVGIVGFALASYTSPGAPFIQWFTVTPAICMGAALAVSARQRELAWGLALLFLAVFSATGSMLALQQSIALGAVLLVIYVTLPQTQWSRTLAAISLGIYLVHPMFMSILARAGMPKDALYVGLVIALSVLLATGLRRLVPQVV